MKWWGAKCNSTPCVCLIPKKKQILGYNQAYLNFLGFAKDLGTYFSNVAGLIINKNNHLGILEL
jgi:hypothetical protein